MSSDAVWDVVIGLIVLGIIVAAVRSIRRKRRAAYIDSYPFHVAVVNKLCEARPELSEREQEMVFDALCDYFHLCNSAGCRMVAMPSQVVDDAWHGFILYTRGYRNFCKRGFGRFLHHTPSEAMEGPTTAQKGGKRAWRLARARDGINPRQPTRLPLLFSIDRDLNIEDGFFYATNCLAEATANGRNPLLRF